MRLFPVFLVTMKKLLILLSFCLATLFAGAQRVYFIYLQSDNGSPFFVKMGEKVHSSAASGYLILSGLVDSTYTFSVGFPGTAAESKFAVALNKEDKGYLMKPFESGLGLFDLQTLTVTKAIASTLPPAPVDEALLAAADPFTRLLARASDDPTILLPSGPNPSKEAPVMASMSQVVEKKADTSPITSLPVSAATALAVTAIRTDENKPADTLGVAAPHSVLSVPQTDTLALSDPHPEAKAQLSADTTHDVPLVETAPAAKEEVYVRSVVTRRSESSTTEGFGLVFFDRQGDMIDTIRLLIPNPRLVAKMAGPVTEAPRVDTLVANTPAVDQPVELKQESVVVPAKPACFNEASERDFLKLRKNMAAADGEPEMISIARKEFRNKCFSTDQVRLLGTLFLSSVGKFSFFEAAFTHITDAGNFASLEAELKDEQYIRRFKSLTAN
jgi:hypothetical protein